MPLYEYTCILCDHHLEIRQKYEDGSLIFCPSCEHNSLRRVLSLGYIKTSTTTLGSLAERNRREMGNNFYNDAVQKMANERVLPEFKGKTREGKIPETVKPQTLPSKEYCNELRSINKMTPEQKTKYVMEGKKPIGL